MKTQRHGVKGLTLVEVTVAVGILAVSTLGALMALMNNSRGGKVIRSETLL